MSIQSIGSRLYYRLLRLINKKKFLEMQFAFARFDFYNCKAPPQEIFRICNVEKTSVAGCNVFTLSPKGQRSSTHILYLHGGAYVQSFVKQHWRFLSLLVRETNCTIIAPDYPLAPQHTYRDVFEMLLPLYEQLLRSAGVKRILMGDSAGGGLSLALAQKIKLQNMAAPSQIILLSPWLDITLTNAAITELDRVDPFLSIKGLRKAGLVYAGGADPNFFMLSPINGDLKDIGPISLLIGTFDILVADARKLNCLAKQQQAFINYREYPGMVHVWMFLNFPEARYAQKEIIKLIMNNHVC